MRLKLHMINKEQSYNIDRRLKISVIRADKQNNDCNSLGIESGPRYLAPQ